MKAANGTGASRRSLSGWALGVLLTGLGVSGHTVAQVDNNPDVIRACGADIVLLLDASNSIRTWQPQDATELDRNGAVDLVTDAAYSFLDAFANTNSRVAVVSYNIDATRQLGFRPVTDHTLRSDGPFRRAIGDPGTSTDGIPSGAVTGYVADVTDSSLDSSFFTNWEAGLLTARDVIRPDNDALATRDGLPLLVFHVTDGDPNRRLDGNGDVTAAPLDTARHVSDAAGVADMLKEIDGAHIYTVGVGLASPSIPNLVDISGPDIYSEEFTDEQFDPLRDDVLIASDFDKLNAVLDGVVLSLCSPSLVVRKWEQQSVNSDNYAVASGWVFDVEPTADDSGWNWVRPDDGSSVISDEDGIARFEWEVVERNSWDAGSVTVRETDSSERYDFDNATCAVTAGENAGMQLETSGLAGESGFSVALNTNEIVTCDVYNDVTEDPPVDQPEIVLDKHTDWETYSRVGEVIDYTYQVTNIGPGILSDIITVDDDTIDNVVCPASLPNGELLPGEFVVCTASYTIQTEDIERQEVVNVAVAYAGVLVSNADFETIVYEPPQDLQPNIVLDKHTDSEIYTRVGEVIDYTYQVTNIGPGVLRDVVTVEDNKIANVVCPGTLPNNELLPGEFVMCNASYTITPEDIDQLEVVNVAVAYAGVLVSNADFETIVYDPPEVLEPSIVLDKHTDQETFNEIGEVIDYTYRVTNAGPGILTDVITVEDNKINEVVCPLSLPGGELAPSEFVICTGSYVIVEDDIGNAEVVNVARAFAGELQSNEDDERVVYTPPVDDETEKEKETQKDKATDTSKGKDASTDQDSGDSQKAADGASTAEQSVDTRRRLSTRSARWYSKRPGAVASCLDAAGGEIDLGAFRIADENYDDEIDAFVRGSTRGDNDRVAESGLSLAIGLLNADTRRFSDGSRRSSIDQLCVAASRAALAAQCNVQWLQTEATVDLSGATDMIAAHCRGSRREARANAARMQQLKVQLRKFNRSGRGEALPLSRRGISLRAGPVQGDDPTDSLD